MSMYSEALVEFHGHPNAILDDKTNGIPLRRTLMREEIAELCEAWDQVNRAHVAREAADVFYVSYGTALVYGEDLDDYRERYPHGGMIGEFESYLDDNGHALDRSFSEQHATTVIMIRLAWICNITADMCRWAKVDLDLAFQEVHRAAMYKMDAGLRREDGKILKPPGFTPPDMTEACA